MKNVFNSIKVTPPKRNTFDLTHDVKMSGKMGHLIPCMTMECIPGDTFKISNETLIRFAPLTAPVMHRMNATIHYFWVPNRIIWSNWEKFITRTEVVSPPYITARSEMTSEQKRFLMYMGVPDPKVAQTEQINALPFAAYQKIYNDYYRDQNLITDLDPVIQLVDGDNVANELPLTTMRNRAWEHDYFTASLPFAQKGDAVDIPLGEITLKDDWSSDKPRMVFPPNNVPVGAPLSTLTTGPTPTDPSIATGAYNDIALDPNGSLEVQPTTINTLRIAYKLQEFLEKMARGGSRYIEQIKMIFGVKSSDARLQRPEYITGSKTPVTISEVLNTTGEILDSGNPQGNMAGHAVSVGEGTNGTYFCEEHGFIIGILSVTPKPAYFQGLHKQFLKRDPLEYFWPQFANIGEQEVKNREIYAYTNNGDGTFGYIPRYSEYRYQPNRVAGDFTNTLLYWHLARDFASLPTLSKEFIEVTPEDVERIFAVEDGEDNLYIHVLNKVIAIRPIPVYGTPMF